MANLHQAKKVNIQLKYYFFEIKLTLNLFQLGISLSIDQFKELVKVIPHLESEIA